MASSLRSFAFIFGILIAVIPVVSPLTVARAAEPSDPVRVTSVANATVRTAPAADAAAVAQLPLGTEVQEAGPGGLDKTWVLVRLGDAREGWLLTRLTKPLDPVWKTEVYDAIIAERLSRKGDGFNALAELVSFIDRAAPDVRRRGIARQRRLVAAAGALARRGGNPLRKRQARAVRVVARPARVRRRLRRAGRTMDDP